MSLCNTFRFLAVSTTIVLSIVGSPVPGQARRDGIASATTTVSHDLEHQGSLTVELKSSDKGTNYMNSLKLTDNVKADTNSILLDPDTAKKNMNKNSHQIITFADKTTQDVDLKDVEKTSSKSLEPVTNANISTETLNITSVTQETEETVPNTNKFENEIFANRLSQVVEKTKEKTSVNADQSQKNDTVNENKIQHITITTTVDFESTTQATSLENRMDSTINGNTETETSPILNMESTIPAKSAKSMKLSITTGGATTPTWKKYTVIERKRVSATSDEISSTDTSIDNMENLASTLSEEPTTVTEKSEVMVKSESAQSRITLQDAITSDIPSLEKLKTDLLSFPKFTTKSDTETTTPSISTTENITKIEMTTFMTSLPSTLYAETPNTVSSKRAGYLDLSPKNSTANKYDDLKLNDTKSLQAPSDAETTETQEETLDDKDRKVASQTQLDEDAIKEELLKEEMLNDNEEISKRHRNEGKQIDTDISALSDTHVNTTQFDDKLSRTTPDENLSVRPINSDKAKNTILYPVNPNYKPLKKLEVQPAKPFVRDPDDNSWRNESLSSLGIVFKPKNSSKPFTQVLKNKTETEWNNLPEKDTKNEVPDLRIRLEQIAQKRKSKKKKVDSFGNVFYTDYEESSSSEENPSTPQTEDPTVSTVPTTDADMSTPEVDVVTPVQTAAEEFPTSAAPASETNNAPALTTTAAPIIYPPTTPKKVPTKATTLKRPKMFNLFDYYEANDDEDITDYLNMAKIDLKRFTVPVHTTLTPYTSPPLPVLYTSPMTHYTQERKGTIQYFPPRPTKRPRKNKHNNSPNKLNPGASTEPSKHVIPISYHELTTPYASEAYYTAGADGRFREATEPRAVERDMYLTTPPLTTTPGDQHYGRPGYVMKQYKEYSSEPGRGELRPSPFALPPADDASDVPDAADYIKPTPARERTTTEDYDYEADFRRDLLDRFVASFDDGSRFRSQLPVLYNTSVVHGAGGEERAVATSRAYFRRPADGPGDGAGDGADGARADCDNATVELSPAYELHYYVPEQEERQEVEPRPLNLPPRYRL